MLMLMLMLSSMIDYSSAMEDASLKKLNMIVFFFLFLSLFMCFFFTTAFAYIDI